jgi:hypothetical protein
MAGSWHHQAKSISGLLTQRSTEDKVRALSFTLFAHENRYFGIPSTFGLHRAGRSRAQHDFITHLLMLLSGAALYLPLSGFALAEAATSVARTSYAPPGVETFAAKADHFLEEREQ